jgi:tungstate transport system substrate-binding protein
MALKFRVTFLLLLFGCNPEPRPSVRIATTTSLEGSGFLRVLREAVRRDLGLELEAFVVGSGQALRLAERGEAAVVITHDPAAEAAFVARQRPALYRQFMWNEFIVVGPESDPARVRDAPTAVDAFRRIAGAGAPFCSRGDQSGTHARELRLWRQAGMRPAADKYLQLGQSMAHLLRSADELQCYALSDRATFDHLRSRVRLGLLFEGDPALRNVYAVSLLRDSPPGARRFVEWLLSSRGRALIESFRIDGRQQFFSVKQPSEAI